MNNIKFGWKKDKPDDRDHRFSVSTPKALPSYVDLRELCPPVYDQGSLGSCSANATAAAYQFDQIKQRLSDFFPSRLFIYFNARDIEGTTQEDGGSYIRDNIKSIVKKGTCSEQTWPYYVERFAQRPEQRCYDEALEHQAVSYARVSQTLDAMKGCLADGLPFVVGIYVYESFLTSQVSKTGIVPMPAPNEKFMGGHAIMIVGYDDTSKMFIARNSWGQNWGIKGYFMIPYEYLTSIYFAADLWVIKSVETDNVIVNNNVSTYKKKSIWTRIKSWFKSLFG